MYAAPAASGPDPRDQMVGLFDALSSACQREGYRGCGFINAAAESPPGTPVHARTVAHKQAVHDWVRDLAVAAGAAEWHGMETVMREGPGRTGRLLAAPDQPAPRAGRP